MSLQDRVLGIFPGSRSAEINRHWPLFRAAAHQLLAEQICDRVVVAATDRDRYPEPGPIMVHRGDPAPVFAAADVALAKSGTTTLEAALADTPMVVAYLASRLTRMLAARMMTVRWISLVNLIAGWAVVPELWRSDVSSSALVSAARPLFVDGPARRGQLEGLAQVREHLGQAGAAERVAGMALELVGA
jgi:lipid-A-disaccharide synthase